MNQPINQTRILDKCQAVLAERGENYGDPSIAFNRIAQYWSLWLNHTITGTDVAMMMTLFKVAREQGKHQEDNLVDAINYLNLFEQVRATAEEKDPRETEMAEPNKKKRLKNLKNKNKSIEELTNNLKSSSTRKRLKIRITVIKHKIYNAQQCPEKISWEEIENIEGDLKEIITIFNEATTIESIK